MPLKKALTVPRLELLGAYILSNLINTVYESLNVELNIENYYCWVDSQIVLAWIKTPLVNSLKRCGKSLKFYSKEGRPRELVLLPDR